jgi:hypothetical protein
MLRIKKKIVAMSIQAKLISSKLSELNPRIGSICPEITSRHTVTVGVRGITAKATS